MIKFSHLQNYRYNYWFSTRLLLPNSTISTSLCIFKSFTCVSRKVIRKCCILEVILFTHSSCKYTHTWVCNLRRDLNNFKHDSRTQRVSWPLLPDTLPARLIDSRVSETLFSWSAELPSSELTCPGQLLFLLSFPQTLLELFSISVAVLSSHVTDTWLASLDFSSMLAGVLFSSSIK